MMFIYKPATFAQVWTTIPKIREIFEHGTLTEHALCLMLASNVHCPKPALNTCKPNIFKLMH